MAFSMSEDNPVTWISENIGKTYLCSVEAPELGECKCPEQCDALCLNRVIYHGCFEGNCHLQAHCCNSLYYIRMQEVYVGIIAHESKGNIIIALQPFLQNDWLGEYRGEIITSLTADQRQLNRYIFDCQNGAYIDASRYGSKCRYISHSCDPNAVCDVFKFNKTKHIVFHALKPIAQNEEITIDYGPSYHLHGQGQPCQCGSENCSGFIGLHNESSNIELRCHCALVLVSTNLNDDTLTCYYCGEVPANDSVSCNHVSTNDPKKEIVYICSNCKTKCIDALKLVCFLFWIVFL